MFTTTVVGKKEVAEGTMEFRFERPSDFTYHAGQSIDLIFEKPPETDEEGDMRSFSLVSTPEEKELRIATRMRDTAFKRNLKNIPEGTKLSLKGPFGSFALHEHTDRPAVFLAGGIGITPFHSMMVDATERSLPHAIYLFYSNRTPDDALYYDELQELAEKNPRFTLVATMTDSANLGEWKGETGYITAAMLSRHLPKESAPIYYLAGPERMVTAMRTMLTKEKVSNDDIRVEQFAGY